MTASPVPPVSAASLTAQRRPARDDGEPSTPATIRGALLVLLADIRTSPSALFRHTRLRRRMLQDRACSDHLSPQLTCPNTGPWRLGRGVAGGRACQPRRFALRPL